MSRLTLTYDQFDELGKVLKAYYGGDAEDRINEVLHGEAGDLIQERIRQFMPVSGITWKGKAKPAKTSKSMRNENEETLAVTVRAEKKYQYLYFPDDGSNTEKHYGDQQFFARGGEAASNEIIDRCIANLLKDF